jgi:hypothetical protein
MDRLGRSEKSSWGQIAMGRGQQAQVNRDATGLLNTETTNANAANPQAAYASLLANPGYTPAQKTAITGATEGGVGAAFGSAEEGAVNRAARTNNAAGLSANEDALARQRMITSGNLAAQNEAGFAGAARGDRNLALGGLGGLYGTNLGGANQTLGTKAGNARTPGFWDTFGNSFANAAGGLFLPGQPGAGSYGWNWPKFEFARLRLAFWEPGRSPPKVFVYLCSFKVGEDF